MTSAKELQNVLLGIGRPVAFLPGLTKITHNTNATLFLSQMIYWTGKGADPNGWIYKQSKEITEETGLSYDEQYNARKILKHLGILMERNRRLLHMIYYKVNFKTLADAWSNSMGTCYIPDGEPLPTSSTDWLLPDGELVEDGSKYS